jgi:hypothetical protein
MSQADTHHDLGKAVVSQLDHLIARLEKSPAEPGDLLLEHIYSARTYWLGAMPQEFVIAMEDARQAAGELQNEDERDALDQAIGRLLAEVEQMYPHSTSTP